MPDLSEHLREYGILYFADDQYWEWGAIQLGERKADKLDRIRLPLQEGRATPEEMMQFYDFIADPKVAGVVHSLKTDAIRASGHAIAEHLGGEGRVLDLGCGLGYLTTWYARLNSRQQVVGVDVSEKTIRQARRFAGHFGLRNVELLVADITVGIPGGPYDVIVDSQSLSTISNLSSEALSLSLKSIRNALKQDGKLVSVSALPDSESAKAFTAAFNQVGLGIQSFDFLFHSDLGQAGGYPLIVASLGPQLSQFDYEKAYERALECIRDQTS